MEVILQQDLKNLGKKGQIVNVAEGYGRNYLIPRGLAIAATKSNLRALQQQQAVDEKRGARELSDAERIKAALDGMELEVKAKSGESGRLFGSVTSTDLVAAIKDKTGIELDKRRLDLRDPIRNVGAHQLSIKLMSGITAELIVKVEPE